jgi:glucose/mannose-6-phosphate isomerase
MHSLVQNYPNQLEDALSRFSQIDFWEILQKSYSTIVCAGLGGSGIAASLMQSLCIKYAPIPYVITKSYELPACTTATSLFLACSHSGNTEETIEATKLAHEAGATIIVITSGGWMKSFALENNLFLIELPAGMMPRACYTYAVVAQLMLFKHMGYIHQVDSDISESIRLIHEKETELKATAQQMANDFSGKMPVLYSDELFAPVAMRFRQQLNENSKILCRNAVLPEMNHNEILGRKNQYLQCVPLFLRHSYEHERTSYRIELSKEIIFPKVETILEVSGIGTSLIQEILTMTYILDRVSVYLADLRQIDPMEIETINFLKGKLAEKR